MDQAILNEAEIAELNPHDSCGFKKLLASHEAMRQKYDLTFRVLMEAKVPFQTVLRKINKNSS